MLFGGSDTGGLELRRKADGTVRLRGKFPYGKIAVLSDGGRTGKPRKEIIAPKAFAYRIETPSDHGGPKDIHLLSGHEFAKPLASVRSGTLTLTDTPEAVGFMALISEEMQQIDYVKAALAGVAAGLAYGLSPGFRLPPERRVKKPEVITQEEFDPSRDMFGAVIRTVMAGLLYELSIVTRAAYAEAQVEMRNWSTDDILPVENSGLHQTLNRWRV